MRVLQGTVWLLPTAAVLLLLLGTTSAEEGDLGHLIRDGQADDPASPATMSLKDLKETMKAALMVIDSDDDGALEGDEIRDWMMSGARLLRDAESRADFTKEDEDRSGGLSWEELAGDAAPGPLLEERKQLFEAADQDDDGHLSAEEFTAYSQPDEDPQLLAVLVRQVMDRKDRDLDGKISLKEFRENDGPMEDNDEDEFDEEDVNDDGFMDEGEVTSWLQHDYSSEVQVEVARLLAAADDDEDGQLSYEELLEEPQLLRRSSLMGLVVQLRQHGSEAAGARGQGGKEEL